MSMALKRKSHSASKLAAKKARGAGQGSAASQGQPLQPPKTQEEATASHGQSLAGPQNTGGSNHKLKVRYLFWPSSRNGFMELESGHRLQERQIDVVRGDCCNKRPNPPNPTICDTIPTSIRVYVYICIT